MAPPRPLLDIFRELNERRDGAPSHWLNEMRAATAGWQKYKETAQGRELIETMRRIQESGLAERLMGRMRPISPPQPDSAFVKRKRGMGRKPSLTPDQVKEGISILHDQPRMTVEAACATLKQAGIKTSNSALYRLVIQPAYAG
jgi:hypothetical protein